MDRSFLSHPAVVSASRSFVCARLATYESAEEAELLSAFDVGRSGQLENTVFAILAPDGETELVRSGRSPHLAFGDGPEAAERMAQAMKRIARQYPGRANEGIGDAAVLPTVDSVRLALNVAACDGLPLTVALDGAGARQLAQLAWSEPFAGRFVYAVASSDEDRARLHGVRSTTSIAIVRPNEFGTELDVLDEVSRGASNAKVSAALERALTSTAPRERSRLHHVAAGREQGVDWQTAIPVTDPHARGGVDGAAPEGAGRSAERGRTGPRGGLRGERPGRQRLGPPERGRPLREAGERPEGRARGPRRGPRGERRPDAGSPPEGGRPAGRPGARRGGRRPLVPPGERPEGRPERGPGRRRGRPSGPPPPPPRGDAANASASTAGAQPQAPR